MMVSGDGVAGTLSFHTNSAGNAATERMRITASGSVGIGTTAPAAKLEVASGEVKVGTSGAACSTTNAGAICWNGNAFVGCNGVSWITLGGSLDCTGAIGTACSDGTVVAGGGLYVTPCDAGMTGTKVRVRERDRLTLGRMPYPTVTACPQMDIDWRLPTIDELQILNLNRTAITGFNTTAGTKYRSSTIWGTYNDVPVTNALTMNSVYTLQPTGINGGNIYAWDADLATSCYVRCVRG